MQMVGKEKLATASDCQPLFKLMNRVRELAPWDWMEERDLFGVQHPDTGENLFVSIMGMAGEHYAVAAYRGAEGLYGFWDLQDQGPFMQPEDLLNVPEVQASWEDRDILEKHDYQLIKSLGLKYRGRNAWPMFRSYRPGYAPWYIVPEEAEVLRYVLEQVLEVAPRARQETAFLDPYNDDRYLVRVARRDGAELTWEDQFLSIKDPRPAQATVEVPPELIQGLKPLASSDHILEADFFLMSILIGERDERPYFPYGLMVTEASSGMVMVFKLIQPAETRPDTWRKIIVALLEFLLKLGSKPAQIRVSNGDLDSLLTPIKRDVGLDVRLVRRLRSLERAREEMEHYMGF